MAYRSKASDRLNMSGAGTAQDVSGSELPGEIDSQLVLRAAQSNCTILITGETGVGKGHLARWIHDQSGRGQGPFIPVNCGAIPETLVDSQLFGHSRGAFSGATSEHLGLVRAAQGGTMLLDEVGELPLSSQNRLLRLLQEREIQPVGHSKPLIVDVRIIAATNGNLGQAVVDHKFREDLLFRLEVIRLRVKPLRERPNELPVFLKGFNEEFAHLYRQPPLDFDLEALHLLSCYHWPGNVRQVRSLVERLHVLCPHERITDRHIFEFGQLNPKPTIIHPLIEVERLKLEQVRQILSETGGSIAQAAEVYGVHRSTIYRWLRAR
jgi:DNA-binding NtrC family response regulator